jgi:hypothetical protein
VFIRKDDVTEFEHPDAGQARRGCRQFGHRRRIVVHVAPFADDQRRDPGGPVLGRQPGQDLRERFPVVVLDVDLAGWCGRQPPGDRARIGDRAAVRVAQHRPARQYGAVQPERRFVGLLRLGEVDLDPGRAEGVGDAILHRGGQEVPAQAEAPQVRQRLAADQRERAAVGEGAE